jgi:hypothetical protein
LARRSLWRSRLSSGFAVICHLSSVIWFFLRVSACPVESTKWQRSVFNWGVPFFGCDFYDFNDFNDLNDLNVFNVLEKPALAIKTLSHISPCKIKNKTRLFLLLTLLSASAAAAPAFPWDAPFNHTANWGGTGLLEIPNARILEDGVIRAGVAQALPYRWYYGSMGVFPGLEVGGRLSQITNIPSGLGPDYGSNKDKAIDFKYQIFPESKKFPALAFGFHDIIGTQLFEAQYLVMSRQIFPLDFTVGIGRKRLKGLELPFYDKVGFFGGVEVALHPKIHLLAEYNPIDYEDDLRGARGAPEGAEWPLNFGMRYIPFPGIGLGLSYQRGDTLGLSVHIQASLGESVLPQKADPPPQVAVDRRPFDGRDIQDMVDKIHAAIHKAGFGGVTVYTDARDLTAEFHNTQYLSNQKAAGRVLRVLLLYAPADTRMLRAVVKKKNLPIIKASVQPDHLEKYLLGEIPDDIFQKLLDVQITQEEPDPDQVQAIRTEDDKLAYDWGIKPSFQTYLNDPSGFFKFRAGVKPYAIVDFWKGAQGVARYDVPFYSNIESSNIPVPDAVVSDSWKYLDDSLSFDRLLVDQTLRFSERIFGRVSVGYFDKMFAGVGGEVLAFLGDGNIAVGIESDYVRKREPGAQFALLDQDFHTILANAYYYHPKLAATVEVEYGRFMAGDVGWLFKVNREYDTGIIVGAWYSITDTDDLTGYNKGYNEKGVFLSLPARIFLTHDSPERYYYNLRPWSRDVAAKPTHWLELFDLGYELMPAFFKSRTTELKE